MYFILNKQNKVWKLHSIHLPFSSIITNYNLESAQQDLLCPYLYASSTAPDGRQLEHHRHKEGSYRSGMLCIGRIVGEKAYGTC